MSTRRHSLVAALAFGLSALQARHIAPDKLVMGAKVVPSGVAEIGRLQAREGFVYLKP